MADRSGPICFLNSTKAWGGGEKWHLEMAQELFRQGYAVRFATHRKSILAQKLGETQIPTRFFPIGNLSFLNIILLLRIKRFFQHENISILIMNLPSDIKAAGIAARWAGVKKIIYRRGSAVPIRDKPLNRFLFRQVLTDVIANSEATKKTILEKNTKLFPPEKIRVIYNGIQLKPAGESADKPLYRPNNGEIVLGHAGRMVYQKGHDLLLEIASHLKEAQVNFKLLVAGTGPLEKEIKNRVRQLDLDDDILFIGFTEDIHHFMQSIDIFLLTSRWEGFGFVLAEAMAAEKPIVCFNISSNPELVINGRNGFLARPFDTREFASYVQKLADDDRLREKFASEGYRLVNDNFTFDRSVSALKDMLRIQLSG